MGIPSSRAEKIDGVTRRVTRWVTQFAHWVSVHWLLMLNLALAFWTGLPFVAPVLAHAGYMRGARFLYWIFRPLCHQMPERSFFLFGERWAYSYEQLSGLLGGITIPQRWIGLDGIGFKTAVCQRDVAIFGSMMLAGLVFALVRGRLRALPPKAFGLLILPMAIDGVGQLLGLWSSTWVSRVITGSLFGASCIWFVSPYVERGMRDVRRDTERALQEQRI